MCVRLCLLKLFPLQVVIGGRNKYLINGVNANNTRVYDLFCSVGLNVNNPHFLIMQVFCLWTLYLFHNSFGIFLTYGGNTSVWIFHFLICC